MISFTCPTCGRAASAPDSAAGRRTRCPGCQAPFTIPMESPRAATEVVVAPPVPREPNFYRTLEICADVVGCLYCVVAGLVVLASMVEAVLINGSLGFVIFGLPVGLLSGGLIVLGGLVQRALLLLVVDVGRSLRAVMRNTEKGVAPPAS